MKKQTYILLFFCIFAAMNFPVFAQAPPPPPPPPGLPIDGGLLFLIVGAVGYAIKKLK